MSLRPAPLAGLLPFGDSRLGGFLHSRFVPLPPPFLSLPFLALPVFFRCPSFLSSCTLVCLCVSLSLSLSLSVALFLCFFCLFFLSPLLFLVPLGFPSSLVLILCFVVLLALSLSLSLALARSLSLSLSLSVLPSVTLSFFPVTRTYFCLCLSVSPSLCLFVSVFYVLYSLFLRL